jgi:hypothetical protein
MARTGVAAAAAGYDKRPTPDEDASQKNPIVRQSCKVALGLQSHRPSRSLSDDSIYPAKNKVKVDPLDNQ